MAKRLAFEKLNPYSADEEEPEERGQFKTADKEELGRRVIKTATRRLPNSASNPFAAFAFGAPPASSTLVSGSAAASAPSNETKTTGSVSVNKLTSFNKCFVNYLKKHLNSNPCCDLTPVFSNYKQHLDEIRGCYSSKPEPEPTESVTEPLAMDSKPSMPDTTGSFTYFQTTKADANSANPSSESSKSDVGSRATSETKTFSFSISTTSPGTAPALTFSSKPSFGFSAIASASTQDSNGSDEEEEYVPPKEHITPVEEKDAVYTKECKLFQKKDNCYADRGVGILYIKPQNDKYQLLIRAHTRIGNILLNIMLAPTLPTCRLGKNSVALVFMPNPPVNSEVDSASPTTILLRVRTAEGADELKCALDFYKFQAAAQPTSSTTLVSGSAATSTPSNATKTTGSVSLNKLTSSNKCFVNYLKKHLNSNPCCDFTPVFPDYKRHLDEIRGCYSSKPKPTESATAPLAMDFKPSIPDTTGSFTYFQTTKADANSANPSSESSKSDVGSRATSDTKTFSFSISTTSPGTAPALTFSSKPSFGFSAIASASTQDSNGSDEEEEYVPPKEHITPVEEKDAVYTKECKLFQKKDNCYADRGVGILYIKPQNDKYQLLIRAHTRIGNILLNIMLAPTLPTCRLGKNSVALVFMPNPPVNSEVDSASPTTILLRARTAEDADELKSALDFYKFQAAN